MTAGPANALRAAFKEARIAIVYLAVFSLFINLLVSPRRFT